MTVVLNLPSYSETLEHSGPQPPYTETFNTVVLNLSNAVTHTVPHVVNPRGVAIHRMRITALLKCLLVYPHLQPLAPVCSPPVILSRHGC